MKTAVFVLNFGGPGSLKEVRPFLFHLFNEPEILIGVPAPIRFYLAAIISLIKGRSSKKAYAKIGGGSPQLYYTKKQSEQLEMLLQKKYGDKIKIFVAMRAWRPFIADVAREVKLWNPDKIILLPLFPQNSITTTVSCLREAKKHLNDYLQRGQLFEINGWHDNKEYIRLLQHSIQEQIITLSPEEKEKSHVLFSAHSLPLKTVRRGDVYPEETKRTVELVAANLSLPWSLSFQSRNGPLPWLEPYTDREIIRLAKLGIKNLIVVPVSFVSDHIETLYELDIEFAHLAKRNGIEKYLRARVFNEDLRFTELLANLVQKKLL